MLKTKMTNDLEVMEEGSVVLKIKDKKTKSDVRIPAGLNGEECFSFISKHLRISQENLKLVSRGKLINKENISSFMTNNAVFQAFGEEAENEDGLDQRDIVVLMAQLSVERNVAIKALRKTGDLIDAIFYLSDNM